MCAQAAALEMSKCGGFSELPRPPDIGCSQEGSGIKESLCLPGLVHVVGAGVMEGISFNSGSCMPRCKMHS